MKRAYEATLLEPEDGAEGGREEDALYMKRGPEEPQSYQFGVGQREEAGGGGHLDAGEGDPALKLPAPITDGTVSIAERRCVGVGLDVGVHQEGVQRGVDSRWRIWKQQQKQHAPGAAPRSRTAWLVHNAVRGKEGQLMNARPRACPHSTQIDLLVQKFVTA